MRRRTAAGLTWAAVAVVCLALGGCAVDAGDTDEPAGSVSVSSSAQTPTSSTPSSQTITSAAETTATSRPPASPPTSTKTPSAGGAAARARAAQIKAADLPGFNDQWVWDRSKAVRGPGPQPPPVCSVTGLDAIGASAVYRTNFASSLSSQAFAVQVTAVFPDVQTAVTAERVLLAWHDRCQRRVDKLGLQDAEVAALSAVPTKAGPAQQWMTTYRPVPGDSDSVWFNAEGFVRSADMITYLVIRNAGQDYNYPRGEEPVARALGVAASYLLDGG